MLVGWETTWSRARASARRGSNSADDDAVDT